MLQNHLGVDFYSSINITETLFITLLTTYLILLPISRFLTLQSSGVSLFPQLAACHEWFCACFLRLH